MKYRWKEAYQSIIVDKNCYPKCYGKVHLRNGRIIFRNYKRPLKNGGVSLIDLYEKKYSEMAADLIKNLNKKVYAATL